MVSIWDSGILLIRVTKVNQSISFPHSTFLTHYCGNTLNKCFNESIFLSHGPIYRLITSNKYRENVSFVYTCLMYLLLLNLARHTINGASLYVHLPSSIYSQNPRWIWNELIGYIL